MVRGLVLSLILVVMVSNLLARPPKLPHKPTVAELLSSKTEIAVRDLEAAVSRELKLPPSVSVSQARHSDLERQTFALSSDAKNRIEVSYVRVRDSDGKPTFALIWRDWERVRSWLK